MPESAPARDFNPRSPHGERRDAGAKNPARCRFQSTLPARGATEMAKLLRQNGVISIHAPRTGSDMRADEKCGNRTEISIHAPRTGSDVEDMYAYGRECISIHAPRTGSDLGARRHGCRPHNFNPRSPHGERQHGQRCAASQCNHFNPRSPHGERHHGTGLQSNRDWISIHAPRTGSDVLAKRN